MENMEFYNSFRTVPDSAKKTITGGRLKGMTDINPMWRIQMLTERFGPCGVGWKYIIRDKRLEHGPNDEIAAIVDIDLFYKADGVWSDAVPGTGGSMFAVKERSGLYVSDECFKMALTDALSVACKALGMGSDVYWSAGRTKYDTPLPDAPPPPPPEPPVCSTCGGKIIGLKRNGEIISTANQLIDYSIENFGKPLCWKCIRASESGTSNARPAG